MKKKKKQLLQKVSLVKINFSMHGQVDTHEETAQADEA
jgi:hypothetical protein